jgi:hypothetical protein
MADSLLDAVDFFKRLPGVAEQAAQLSINSVATRAGMTLIRRSILDEIAFPKDYLSGDRLAVAQKARPGDLEAVIRARQRPTSLARFAAPGTALGSRARIGVRVGVRKGRGRTMRNAWLVRLNNGNIGLALRLKPGERLDNKNEPHRYWLVPNRVALLYGPSVDQVFRHVSEDVAAPIGNMVAEEFFRQFARLA